MAVDIAGNIRANLAQIPRASELKANRLVNENRQVQNELGRQNIQSVAQQTQRRNALAGQEDKDYAKQQMAQYMGAIAANPAQVDQITSMPEFQQMAESLGIAPDSFQTGPNDTPEVIQRAAASLAQALGGSTMGNIGNTDLPSDVRNDLYYRGLNEDEREEYIARRRNAQVVDVGGVPSRVTPTGGTAPLSTPENEAAGAQRQAAATTAGQQGGTNLTPGQRQVDVEFGKEYVEWRARGGFADVIKSLEQLDGVRTQLRDPNADLTGGFAQGNAPDFVLAFIDPEALAARDQVEEVVQRNLRLVLGAQFTEQEGKRLIARAYNPRLSEEENAKRIERLMQAMTSAAQAKQSAADHFEQNGTLAGWSGETFTIDDFYDAIEGTGGSGQQQQRIRVDAEGNVIGN